MQLRILGLSRYTDNTGFETGLYCCGADQFWKGETQTALYYAQESLRYADATESPFYRAAAYFTQAQLYYLTDETNTARDHLATSCSIASEMQSYFHLFRAQLLQAVMALAEEKKDGALMLLRNALKLAKQYDISPNLWISDVDLARISTLAIDNNIEADIARNILKKNKVTPELSSFSLKNGRKPICINTLGRFEIYINGELLKLPGRNRPKVFLLLKVLIAFGGEHVAESVI